MSLQVWLPLNGNANNQGLIGNLTQTNALSYVNGKMGKAMSTGGLSMTSQQAKEVFNAKEMSFCFWIYVSSDWTGGRVLFGNEGMTAPNNRKFTIFQYPNPDDLHLSWQTQASNGTDVLGIIYSDFFTLNAWTHTAITYEQQSKLVKLYKNGILVQTYTCGTVYTDGENFANATQVITDTSIRYLNDFRIYDHCLSAKEVKEMSKGLCLHYQLKGFGQPNLCTLSSTNIPPLTSGAGTSVWSATSTSDSYKISCTTSGSGGRYCIPYPKANATIGQTYTWSIDIRANKVISTGIGHECGGTTTKTITTNWTRLTHTWNFTDSSYQAFIIYPGTAAAVGDWIEVKNLKIELGSKATPWCPNSTDSLYSSLGFNSNIESDCSGFGNSGAKSGSIISNSNSPRYSSSYNFIPSSRITSTTGMPVGSNTVFTMNFWLYIPSGKTFTQWGDFIGFNGNNIRLETSNTSASHLNWYNYPVGSANGLTGFSLTKDTWNMITLVCDGSKFIQYLNGSLLANTNLSGTAFSTNGSIWIGDTTNMYFNMSDLRIYATALSAADIKELYNSPISIDKSGNLFAYEFKEI